MARDLHRVWSGAGRAGSEDVNVGPIDEACEKVLKNVDGAVVCGVVDLSSGIVLGTSNGSAVSRRLNDSLSVLSVELFASKEISILDSLWGQQQAGEGVDEIDVATERAHHFAKSINNGKAALLLVTDRSANIGMGWAQIRSALPQLEPHVP